MKKLKTVYGRIKEGTFIGQDFRYFTYPDVPGLLSPRIIFEITPLHEGSNQYKAKSQGFGMIEGDYGNGALYFKDIDNVELCSKEEYENENFDLLNTWDD